MALLVDDVTPTVQYTATAAQTTFAYPFAIFEDEDLKVYQVSSSGTPDDVTDILTLTTHYTVTGAGTTAGGNVVLVTGATVGDVITIRRDLAVKRTTDYQANGDLLSTSFNDDLDKLTMMVQQNEEAFGRSISLEASTQTPTTFNIDDPVADYFAVAKTDLSGIKWVTALTTGTLSVTPYIETLLNDSTALEARGTLGAASLTTNETITADKTYSGDNTFSGANSFSGINTFTANNDFQGSDTFDNIVTSEGANIASASDCDIWANSDGNTVHLTGTTTVIDWGTAPQAGAVMRVICDAATPLTYNATTNDMNTDSSNHTCVAGDVLVVYARSTSSYKVTVIPYAGAPIAISQYGGEYIKLSEVQTSGTNAGTFTQDAWQTRVLNTEDSDTGSHCTLSSNQFTLAAGTYRISATAPAYRTGAHKVKLRNTSDSSDVLIGVSSNNHSATAFSTDAPVVGQFTIASSKTFELQHYCATTRASDGFGLASSFGVSEVYAVVELWKVI